MSGQSIVDRLNAAKHTVAGSALGRAVVKATTEEIMGPKRKHLDYLLQCTSEINVSIPQMADLLIERTQNTSWVVTYKALITIHHLMCFGNERFSQYMASHSSKFTLNNFMDRTGAQGIDMSSYIRKYAFYLNEKRETYKLMGFDFCKVKRGKDDGLLRTMNTEKLLKTLPILQKQLDALLQFDVQPNELTNGVISACFILLSKDLIRLFACYNDGIINLLEKFFDMNKKNCREALEIYKKFLERTDNVAAFLKVAESSGMDKGDIPDLTKAPSSLLEALESHVNSLEGGKKAPNGSAPAAASTATSNANAVNSAINSLNSNTQLSAEEKRRIVEEEAKTLEAFKSHHLKKQTSITTPTSETAPSLPVTAAAAAAPPPQPKSSANDLFDLDLGLGSLSSAPTSMAAAAPSSGGNDLLQLSGANPFMQSIVNQSYASQPMMANPFQANSMMMGGMGAPQMQQMNAFPPMGNPMMPANNQQFDAFGDVLKPTNSGNDLNNMMMSKPQSNGNLADKSQQDKLFSKDLDSSLAQLADNLDINYKNKAFGNKNHQWNAAQQQNQQAKTGGQNWKPGASTTPTMPMAGAWPTAGMAPAGVPMMGAAPMGGAAWMGGAPMAPAAAAMNPFGAPMGMQPQQPLMNPMMMQAQPAGGGMQPQPSRSSANPFDLL